MSDTEIPATQPDFGESKEESAIEPFREETESLVVVFVRHGTTSTTGKILPGRAKGLHLDDNGCRRAADLAEKMKSSLPVAAIYSSPLERTMETASPMAEAFSLPIHAEQRLLECDFGDWTGAVLDDLKKLPAWEVLMKTPESFRFPGGESFVEVQERLESFVNEAKKTHAGQIILAFTHADPIKVALSGAFGMTLGHLHKIYVSPTSTNTVIYGLKTSIAMTVNSQLDILNMAELDIIERHIK